MTSKQIAFIASSFLLVGIIFLYGEITPPPKEESKQPQAGSSANKGKSEVPPLNLLAKREKTTLPPEIQKSLNRYEDRLQEVANQAGKLQLLHKLDSISQSAGKAKLSAYYTYRASKLQSSQDRYLKAGNRFKKALRGTNDSTQRQQFRSLAVQSFRDAIQEDSTASSPRIALANLYLQSRSEVMKGITILLEVVDEYPKHPRANLILGRYGIISGQYDKAIKRLQNVLGADTLYAQAHFHLGEAYFASGNKEEALKHLQKSKELMNNPALRDTINRYIRNIQNI